MPVQIFQFLVGFLCWLKIDKPEPIVDTIACNLNRIKRIRLAFTSRDHGAFFHEIGIYNTDENPMLFEKCKYRIMVCSG